MNYSNWLNRFYSAIKDLEGISAESAEACSFMENAAQNGCPNPEPSECEKIRIYNCVMSSIETNGLECEPYYKDIYSL
jgi:hypothetical protein